MFLIVKLYVGNLAPDTTEADVQQCLGLKHFQIVQNDQGNQG